MTDSLNAKKVASAARVAAHAAIDTLINRLGEMNLQEKVTQTQLHELIGSTRQEPETKKETVAKLDDKGAPVLNESGEAVTEEVRVPTGKMVDVLDRWDIVKIVMSAFTEINPDAFVIEAHGRQAGIYRGSKPEPTVKPEMSDEEKKAARAAAKEARAAQSMAETMAAVLAQLKAQGVDVSKLEAKTAK